MNRRNRRLRAALLVVAMVVIVGAGIVARGAPTRCSAWSYTASTSASNRAARRPPPIDVVIVGDRRQDVQRPRRALPVPAPLPRAGDPQADEGQGAKVIAYDVQFTEPRRRTTDDDALILAVRAARNVVLATTEVDARRARRSIFGGAEKAAALQPRRSRRTRTTRTTPTGASATSPFSLERPRVSFPIAAAHRRARRTSHSCRAATAPGSTSRARRPPSPGSASPTSPAASSSPATCAARSSWSAPQRRSLQDLPPDLDHRRRPDAGPGDPGQRDHHRARGLPAARRAALARHRCCSSRSASLAPLAALRLRIFVGARHRRRSRWPAFLVGAQVAFNHDGIDR